MFVRHVFVFHSMSLSVCLSVCLSSPPPSCSLSPSSVLDCVHEIRLDFLCKIPSTHAQKTKRSKRPAERTPLQTQPQTRNPNDKMPRLVHRSDDTAEKAQVRLGQYHNNIAAIRECYEDITCSLDGSVGKAEVRQRGLTWAARERRRRPNQIARQGSARRVF